MKEAENKEWLNGKLKAPLHITIEMKKEFLRILNNNGTIKTISFMVGYPQKETIIPANELYQAILDDLKELEEKKNETCMPREAYEKRLNEASDTISRLLKTNKDYENTIEKLQEVIVAQALRIVALQKGIVQQERGNYEKTKI